MLVQDSLLPSCGHGWQYTCWPWIFAINAGPSLFTALLWTRMVVHLLPTKCSKNAGPGPFTALPWTWVVVYLLPTNFCNTYWSSTPYCCPVDIGGSTPITHQVFQQMLVQDFTALPWTWVVAHVLPTRVTGKGGHLGVWGSASVMLHQGWAGLFHTYHTA